MKAVAITTSDNPYNPLTQFDEWNAFDIQKGYGTSSYLARIAKTSPELSPEDYMLAIDRAIDEIIRFDLTGKYKKVYGEELKT